MSAALAYFSGTLCGTIATLAVFVWWGMQPDKKLHENVRRGVSVQRCKGHIRLALYSGEEDVAAVVLDYAEARAIAAALSKEVR